MAFHIFIQISVCHPGKYKSSSAAYAFANAHETKNVYMIHPAPGATFPRNPLGVLDEAKAHVYNVAVVIPSVHSQLPVRS